MSLNKQNEIEMMLVMKGSLRDFQLPDVLQVVGASRQHTAVELRNDDGSQRGIIRIKAGQVLAAEHKGHKGRSAFFELFQSAPHLFQVFRIPDSKEYPIPLGALNRLLFEAASDTDPELLANVDLEWDDSRAATAREFPRTLLSESAVSAVSGLGLAASRSTDVVDLRAIPDRIVPKGKTRPRGTQLKLPAVQSMSKTSRESLNISLVEKSGRDLRSKVIVGVSSPKGGAGKTTIALNLARSLAERGLRTLLVDADINGDVLSAVDARGHATLGAFDLLDRLEDVEASLLSTAEPRLKILPACGNVVPVAALESPDLGAAWEKLMRRLRPLADVILVDCPAGMFHSTGVVLRSCTHTVGVFQAQVLSSRSFEMFLSGLDAIPLERRPALAGVVVNMFQRKMASLDAFQSICNDGDRHRLFDTTIPHSDVFAEAAAKGQPLCRDRDTAHPIAWLFNMLADEVCDRIGVKATPAQDLTSFIVP